MILRLIKPFCKIIIAVAPKSSNLRRILVSRVIRHRFEKYLFETTVPLMNRTFLDAEIYESRCHVFGSSHVIYGFDPGAMHTPAWNMGVDSCDFRTMYFLARHVAEKTSSSVFVFCIDFWMRSHQTEFTRGFANTLALDSLGLVPLRHRFLSGYWRRFSERVVPTKQDCRVFRRGYFTGKKHWNVSLAERVARHLAFLKYEPSEMVWLEKILQLVKDFGIEACVAIPPVRADYMELLPKGVDLFLEYKDVCRRFGVKVYDFFTDERFEEDDFGDADHLNDKGAAKFAELLEKYCMGRTTERKDNVDG